MTTNNLSTYRKSTEVDPTVLANGKVFKNYKDLCRQMNWRVCKVGSSSYLAQFKALSTVCLCQKDVDENGKKLSNRLIIKEVYEERKPKADGRRSGYKIVYSNYCIPEEYSQSKGVYRIILDDEVYIGSTRSGFRRRFLGHLKNKQPHTKELLERGGRFEMVELMEDSTKLEILARESYYIDLYLKDERYTLINKNLNFFTLKEDNSLKYRRILVSEEDYERAMELLKVHQIQLKPEKKESDC